MENKSYFKFKCRHVNGQTVTMKIDDTEKTMDDLLELFIDFAIACGYSRATVDESLTAYNV